MRKSDRHYAWLLRGMLLGWLKGAASDAPQLEVKARFARIIFSPKPHTVITNWIIQSPTRYYFSVVLRGNAKQRRQQRRAVQRWLDAHRHYYQPGLTFIGETEGLVFTMGDGKRVQMGAASLYISNPPNGLGTIIDDKGGRTTVDETVGRAMFGEPRPLRMTTQASAQGTAADVWADENDGGNKWRGPR